MTSGAEPGRALTFRPYRPEDRDRVFALWADFIGPERLERRKEIFSCLVGSNPALGDRSPYQVVLDGDRLVAHYGLMPVRFLVRGKDLVAYVCHDIYVHRRFRGPAMGVSDRLVRRLESEADAFILALWFARFNYGLHRRCGWKDLPGCRSMVKIFNPEPFLRHRGPFIAAAARNLAGPVVRLFGGPLRTGGTGLSVERLDSFDERFDALAAEVSREFSAIAIRSADYLSWKYANRPHCRYRIRAASDGGTLQGYVVFRIESSSEERKGLIVDFLCSPRRTDVFRTLVVEALREMSDDGVDFVVALTTRPEFQKVLRRLGFFAARSPSPVMLANWEKSFPGTSEPPIADWFITRGDGDGDFWTMDGT